MLEVSLVKHTVRGSLYAAKVAAGEAERCALQVEATLLGNLVHHPSILFPVETCIGKSLSWIIFPLFPQPASKAKPLCAETFDAYARQVLDGLRHLHKCSVIHADVKPSNTLWDPVRRHAVVCDLGLAVAYPFAYTEAKAPNLYYSAPYRAPELWAASKRSETQVLLHFRTDVWALGCTLLEVSTGRCLFFSSTSVGVHMAIQDYVTARAGCSDLRCWSRKWEQRFASLRCLVWGRLILEFLQPVASKRPALPELHPLI